MINVAVIGISGFGAVHYNDLVREHTAGRARFFAAAVINQEEEAEKCAYLKSIGCKLYTDYRTMLDELRGQIDICFIPTGIALHCPMTVAALEAGANVYVEKPVAATVAETEIMREAERKSGKFIAVGYQTMYQPDTHRIKQLLLDGAIGEPKVFKCYALWPRDDNYYHRNNWAGKAKVNGQWVLDCPFTNALAHYLNLLSFHAGDTFNGTVEPLAVQAGLFRANDIETNDFATIRVDAARNRTLLFYVTHVSEEVVNPISRIEGSAGAIDYTDGKVTLTRADGSSESFAGTPYDEMRKNIFDRLLKRLEDPSAFICTLDIAAKHTLIANAVFDSVPCVAIPKEAIRPVTNEQNVARLVVPGTDEAIRRAWEENRLVDTRDLPWATPGEAFDMQAYRSFRGTYFQK